MSIEEALKKAQTRLKKVEESAKKETTGASAQVICGDEADYRRLMEETFIEEYLEQISEFSFRSTLVPLTIDAALAITKAYDAFVKEKRDWRTIETIEGTLNRLAQQIDEGLKSLDIKSAFVRLSSRSPKDAALASDSFATAFGSYLSHLEHEEAELNVQSSDANRRLHALGQVSIEGLKVKAGVDAIDLLTRSSRIQGDLSSYVEGQMGLANKDKSEAFNIIVREWEEGFDVTNEFRAFIYKRKFTALTQYNEFVFFPRLIANGGEHADQILKITTTFIDKHILQSDSKIKLENMVLDLYIVNDPVTKLPIGVKVVEINPFAEFAGGGLFSWIADKDVLFGKTPFEFRFVEAERKFQIDSISADWRPYVYPKA